MATLLSEALNRIRDYVAANDATKRISFEITANGDWIWSSDGASVQVDLAPGMNGFTTQFIRSDGKVDARLFPLKSSANFSIESRIGCRILSYLGSGLPSGSYESTVVVIVDPEFGEGVADVLCQHPAWVVDTANRASWGTAEPIDKNSALFRVADTDRRLSNLIAVLPDIEDHFGPDSYPTRPYHGIHVIGLSLTPDVEEQLRYRGFRDFQKTDDGFRANFKRE